MSVFKGVLPRGLARALGLVGNELQIWRRHRAGRRIASRLLTLTNLKLNIGCGPNYKPGWVNIDLNGCADLTLDMRERFPLMDKSASIIYSEHLFEHLDYPGDALHFLAECRRVLRSGGRLHIGVPDTEEALLAYANPGGNRWLEHSRHHHPEWATTTLDRINYHFRQGGEHRYAYDFETLRNTLMLAGFVKVTKRDFEPSLDSEFRKIGTLYVEAENP